MYNNTGEGHQDLTRQGRLPAAPWLLGLGADFYLGRDPNLREPKPVSSKENNKGMKTRNQPTGDETPQIKPLAYLSMARPKSQRFLTHFHFESTFVRQDPVYAAPIAGHIRRAKQSPLTHKAATYYPGAA
jgi:hypothetical protein